MRTERRRKTRVQFIPFMRWMLGWYILAFGIIIAMISIVLLVGKAVENHQTKVDLIRSGQYVEPDFQETWNKKSQRGNAD
jgi:hypothetical protein|nr:MAG TPA: Cytochrome c oxidase subunit 1 [Caudoviricetes sp.]